MHSASIIRPDSDSFHSGGGRTRFFPLWGFGLFEDPVTVLDMDRRDGYFIELTLSA
jgi:hypothetical protein